MKSEARRRSRRLARAVASAIDVARAKENAIERFRQLEQGEIHTFWVRKNRLESVVICGCDRRKASVVVAVFDV